MHEVQAVKEVQVLQILGQLTQTTGLAVVFFIWLDEHPQTLNVPLHCKAKVARHPVHDIRLVLVVVQVEHPEGQAVHNPFTGVKPLEQVMQRGMLLPTGGAQTKQFFKVEGHRVQLLACELAA